MGGLASWPIRLAALAGIALLAAPVHAQTMRQATADLAEAQKQAAIATRRAANYEAASAHATDAAEKAKADAAALGAHIQASEADVAAARARIALIDRMQDQQRARLAAKRAPVARLTAALQSLARRPAALALAQPGSIDDIVHVRSALTAILPAIQQKTAALRAEIAASDRLRDQARNATALLEIRQQRLTDQREALARLEAARRLQSEKLANAATFQQDRALALGAKALDITDLMKDLEDQAAVQRRLMTLDGPVLRPAQPSRAGMPMVQAVAPPTDNPRYRLPVVGRVVSGLGDVSKNGVRSRGLTFATAPQALVVSPSSGQIAYAAPFRGYGNIVIIDHGHGWTTLITGLQSLIARVGDSVDPGAPIGRAADSNPRITVELRHGQANVDITPLLAIS